MIAEDSVRFAHSGPSHNLLRPAIAELVSCGPLPLPVSRPLNGRGPSLAMGGMESELVPTEPSQTYPTATVVISLYTRKKAPKSLISRLPC